MNTFCSQAGSVLEVLEPRLAPAGTVILSTAGGVLTATGDDAANGLLIRHIPNTGLWTIIDPVGGTTFILNGVPQGAVPFNIPAQEGIKANFKGGNDEFRLDPSNNPRVVMQLPKGLTVSMGSGNDEVGLGTTSSRNLQIGGSGTVIDLGEGDDIFDMTLSGSFSALFKLLAGAGNDSVRFGGVSAEQVFQKGLTVDLGAGSDALTIEAERVAVAGALTVKAGGGLSSTVNIFSNDLAVDGLMSVTAQQGAVALNFGDADSDVFRLAGGLRLAGGPENDSVTVLGTLLAAGLSLDGKAGNNTVTVLVNASVQAESLTLKGLNGTDTFNVGTNATLAVTDAVSLLLGGGDNTWAVANGASLRLESLRMLGGTGTDIVSFGSSELTVLERLDLLLGAGTNTVAFGAGSNVLLGTLSMIGTTGNDTLAGSGSVFTVHGSLTANLGAGNNTVQLTPSAKGEVGRHLSLSGLGGTDLLQLASPDFSIGGNLQVLLGSGNNTFAAQGTALRVGGSLQYTGGVGNNIVVVDPDELQVGRAFSFKGGADVSTANVLVLAPANGSLGSVSYQGGRHDDIFVLGDSDGVTTVQFSVRGPVSANLGAGANTVAITDTVVHGKLGVLSTSVDDVDSLQLRQSTFHAGASLSLGADSSACSFEDLFVRGPFNLNTGAGDDAVSIETAAGTTTRSEWFGPVKILLGSGDDALSLGIGPPPDANAGSNFYQDVLADGGSGSNTLQSGGNSFLAGSSLTQLNFV